MLDLKIVGGTIVDGTGTAGYQGDVGVKDGRIVALGKVNEAARETIDATGRIVAPGFVDVHTHYDAQAFWDPMLSPSCYHGVTTVFGGFCGFSIAPMTPEAAKYIGPMLARVEGMPLDTLVNAVPWNWRSFGEYLGQIEGNIGLNAGFFAGHSAIRVVAMGARAIGHKATPEELETMKTLLDASLEEGAMGFSTTISPTYNDADGNPVPSRWADRSEFIELAKIVSKHEGTGVEFLPDVDFAPGVAELLADVSVAANRPVNWNLVVITGRSDSMEIAQRQLKVSTAAREKGGEVIALTVPSSPQAYMNLHSGFVFDSLPGAWREVFKLSIPERTEQFRNPVLRRKLEADLASLPAGTIFSQVASLGDYAVVSTTAEAVKKYEGRRIAEIAAAEGKSPLDALLDIALADDLTTIFTPELGGHDAASFQLRSQLWGDDRTLIGGSDAGAHLDMIDTFAYSTTVLEKGVREHKVIGLEEAVHLMTERPATYFGLIDRGLLAPGYHADIVVFDAASIKRGPTYRRYDLPGGNDFRLYAEAEGVNHVLVNGVEIVREGTHTGKLPGKVIRSGKDTRTVALNAMLDHRQAAE